MNKEQIKNRIQELEISLEFTEGLLTKQQIKEEIKRLKKLLK